MGYNKEALVLSVEDAISGNGNKYLKLFCKTESSKAQLYVWDNIEQSKKDLMPGQVFKLNADWDGQYPKLSSYEWVPTSPSLFLEVALTEEEANKYLDVMLDKITDPLFRQLNEVLFRKEARERFLLCVGGKKMHHAKPRALVQHSFEAFSFAYSVANTNPFKDAVDLQLVLEGALLHDYGKMFEYDVDALGNINYTRWISVSGHPAIGAEEVHGVAAQLNLTEEQMARVEALKHIIRSHHLQKEWGAIIEPHTLEAYLVFLADYFSAAYDKFKSVTFDPKTGIGSSSMFKDTFIKFE